MADGEHEETGLSAAQLAPDPKYDAEAFDSMAVVNSEKWNKGHKDDSKLTRADILPHGILGLTGEQLREAFLSAAEHGVTDLIQELHFHCGGDIINCVDSDRYTPLHRASYNGHVEVVEYLLTHGAKVDAQTGDGWQPLHSACRWNRPAVVDLLLQNGALINAPTGGNITPLHLASVNNQGCQTLLLLLTNPDIQTDLRTDCGDTPLDIASRCGNYSNLFVLTEESVDYRKFLSDHKQTSHSS